MSDILVTVTDPGAAGVTTTNGDTYTATVGNGANVSVSVADVSSGNASIVSGTLEIGTVTTLQPGSSATATNVGTGYHAIINLGIPRGDVGPTGATGPANTLTIGTVTTGGAGSNATATITGTAPNQTLNLSLPKGDTGATGKSVELQATQTDIQWRPVGDSSWTSLVSLASITGQQGSTGPSGPANSLSIGTITTGAAGSSASATITGTAPNQTLSLTIPRGDTGSTGSAGAAGAAATVSVGTVTTGAAGSSASVSNSGSSSAAVLDFSIPRGDAGTQVQLRNSGGYVQWKYTTDASWTNLVALADITGPQGIQGPATITVGTTTTLAGGSSATVTNSGTTTDLILDFGVPRGTFGDAQTLSTVTASYTLAAADAGKLVLVSSSSAVTVTVPANASVAIPVGTHIDIARTGGGTVTVEGDTGVTVNSTPGRKLRATYSTGTLIKTATNTWLLVGDLAT